MTLSLQQKIDDRPLVCVDLDTAGDLSAALVARINEACDRAEDAGRGSIFLMRLDGARIATAPGSSDVTTALIGQWENALRRIERLLTMNVAAVQGDCRGAGFALLLTADYRVVMPGARLSVAASSGEILPDTTIHRLANQIGVGHSRRLVQLGAVMTPDEALACGLVDDIAGVEPATLLESLRQVPIDDAAVRRQLLLEASSTRFEDALGAHLAACDRALRHRRRTP